MELEERYNQQTFLDFDIACFKLRPPVAYAKSIINSIDKVRPRINDICGARGSFILAMFSLTVVEL